MGLRKSHKKTLDICTYICYNKNVRTDERTNIKKGKSQIATSIKKERGDIMKNERIYIRISEIEKEELQKEATEKQMSLSEYILNIIRLRSKKK